MFSLVSFSDKDKKVYNRGDEVSFTLKNGYKFKGTFDKVNEFGQVYMSNIKLIKNRKYEDTDITMKLGVYEMSGTKGFDSFALLDDSAFNLKLVSRKGKIEFKEGDKVVVEVNNDVSRVLYSGVYMGLESSSRMLLRDCKVKTSLHILGKGYKESTFNPKISICVDDITSMRINGNASQYKVLVKKELLN